MIRAILFCPDATDDGYGYFDDMLREVEGETAEQLIADALRQIADDEGKPDKKPSLWLRDDGLTAGLREAFECRRLAEIERREAERKAAEEAQAKRQERLRSDRAATLRKKLADVESGAELDRLRAELEELAG